MDPYGELSLSWNNRQTWGDWTDVRLLDTHILHRLGPAPTWTYNDTRSQNRWHAAYIAGVPQYVVVVITRAAILLHHFLYKP